MGLEGAELPPDWRNWITNFPFPDYSSLLTPNGKYHGIDQQGNQMNNATQEACRRWIEDGQRPFDYFKNQNGYQEQAQNDRNGLASTETLNNVSTQLIQPKW